jgi:hypothetical protein
MSGSSASVMPGYNDISFVKRNAALRHTPPPTGIAPILSHAHVQLRHAKRIGLGEVRLDLVLLCDPAPPHPHSPEHQPSLRRPNHFNRQLE